MHTEWVADVRELQIWAAAALLPLQGGPQTMIRAMHGCRLAESLQELKWTGSTEVYVAAGPG